jgi:hypothetical protein
MRLPAPLEERATAGPRTTMKDGPRFNYENNRWAGDIEALRDKYRPVPVKTMFVGESPPTNGTFFYADKSTALRGAFTNVLAVYGMVGDVRDRGRLVPG